MHCCGHTLARRLWMQSTVLSAFGAMDSAPGTPAHTGVAHPQESLSAAEQVLRDHISIDVHTHAGPHGLTSPTARPSADLGRRCAQVASLCSVLPMCLTVPILGRNAQNVLTVLRTPEPGFLWNVHLDRLAWVDELIANHGIRRVLTMADALAAHQSGQPAIIMDIEGLDFLERKLERLEVSYQRGVRTMQLVHYTPNDIGDFQEQGMVTHHGLTAFGAEVIRACHTLGVVVDVAHGTEDMVKQALQVATKPLLLSHTALRRVASARANPSHGTPNHALTRACDTPRTAGPSASGTFSPLWRSTSKV